MKINNDLINFPTIPSVIDNLTSTSTIDALSAKQGKILNDTISNIIEEGNGYIRYNTGLQICYGSTSGQDNGTAYFGIQRTVNVHYQSFQKSFISTPFVFMAPLLQAQISFQLREITNTGFGFYPLYGSTANVTNYDLQWIAIGKWK